MEAGLAMMASKSSAKSLMSVAESESVHSVCMRVPRLKCKTHRQHTQKRPVNVFRPLYHDCALNSVMVVFYVHGNVAIQYGMHLLGVEFVFPTSHHQGGASIADQIG